MINATTSLSFSFATIGIDIHHLNICRGSVFAGGFRISLGGGFFASAFRCGGCCIIRIINLLTPSACGFGGILFVSRGFLGAFLRRPRAGLGASSLGVSTASTASSAFLRRPRLGLAASSSVLVVSATTSSFASFLVSSGRFDLPPRRLRRRRLGLLSLSSAFGAFGVLDAVLLSASSPKRTSVPSKWASGSKMMVILWRPSNALMAARLWFRIYSATGLAMATTNFVRDLRTISLSICPNTAIATPSMD